MDEERRTQLEDVVEQYRSKRFAKAVVAAERVLRAGAACSPAELDEAARFLVEDGRLRGIFSSGSQARSALPFFEHLVALLSELLGPENELAEQAADHLASVHAQRGKPAKAAAVWEKVLESRIRRLGPHHEQAWNTRAQLAIQYRNIGKPQLAYALFTDTGICEHLRSVQDYILSLGVRISYVGMPWSKNCRTWVYFEGVALDAAALRARFNLPEFVTIHDHFGKQDGCEYGLYCERDFDALMGAHLRASPGARLIG